MVFSFDQTTTILNTLAKIAQMVATGYGQHETLHSVLTIIESELSLTRGTVMLLSHDETELIIEAVKNRDAVDHEIRYKWGEGINGKVVETGEPAFIPNIIDEPLFRDRIHRRKEKMESGDGFICVPIKIGNEVVGTLSVDIPHSQVAQIRLYGTTVLVIANVIASDVKSRRMARREREELEQQNLLLRDALGENFKPENFIGNSKAMRDVYMRIYHVAGSDTTTLIRGESGTGKELVASAIHFGSNRREKTFIKVNCAVLSENLLESELFGHEKGAFTGALNTRIGRIEAAQGGTLFLDEIGEISPALQSKLLRVLQEREFERVGSNTTIKVDARIICATNRNLEADVANNLFRQDLFYRINVFPVFIPSLRERKEDILPLANYFLDKFSKKLLNPVRRISTPAINLLMAYHWPGNVRELENAIEYATLLSKDGVIHEYSLPPTLQSPNTVEIQKGGMLNVRVDSLERDMIVDALKLSCGNMTIAARELGITLRMIRYKIKNLGIDYTRLFRENSPGKSQVVS